ncbi:MAG: hypothetical protein AAB038_00380 [Planctomycetota bacterium]
MSRAMKCGIGVAIGGLLYLGIGVADATSSDQEYNLTYKIKNGQKRKCTYELSVAGEVKVITFGRHPLMKFSSKVLRTINDEVLEASADADGKTKTLKLKREYASSVLTALEPVNPSDNDAIKPGPEEKKENTRPDAINKQTIEISYQDGNVSIKPITATKSTSASKQKDELSEDVKALVTLHDGDFALFAPNKKVKVGDEWEVKSDVLAQVLSLKDGRPIRYVHMSPEVGMRFDIHDSSVIKCTFEEVAQVNNIECAKIKLGGQINAIEDGMLKAEITLNGFIYLVIKDGTVHKVELDGEMKMNGEYPSKPTDKGVMLKCRVEGRGKMTLRLQAK